MNGNPSGVRACVYTVITLAALSFLSLSPGGFSLVPKVSAQGGGGRVQPTPTPKKTTAPKKTTPAPRVNPRSNPNTQPTGNEAAATERTYWETIRNSTDAEDFRAYLKKYPNGQFVDLANNRIRALEAANAKPAATPNEQPKSTPATTDTAKAGQPPAAPPETKADAPNHFAKAKALAASDREAAEAEYRIAIRLDPENAEYHNYLSWGLSSQCKNAEAEVEYREAVRLGPTYDRYLGFSEILKTNGKYEESLAALKEAGRLIKPGYAPWHQRLGETLAKMGRWTEADAEFREAIRLGDPAEGHATYGLALTRLRKYPEAEIELKKAIGLAKKENLWLYHSWFSDLLRFEKKWAEAEVESRETIRTYSGGTQDSFWYDLAKALEGQGKLAQAESAFQEGIRSFPNRLGIREWYASWLNDQKRFADAEAVFRELIRLTTSQSPYLYAGLANALKGQNKLAEAETEYRKALHIDAYNLTARYGLPGSLEQQNRLKEAETEYRTLVRVYCSWSSAHSDFGDFLSRQKRWKEAEAEYREALRLYPESTEYPQKLQAAINAQKK